MRSLLIGLVYETFETYPQQPGDPADAHAEFEPESTISALEDAIRHLGHRPLRLGSPHALLEQIGRGAVPQVDAAFNLAEGFSGRNREAWAPVLLEMAGIPAIGSDALSLSLSLDKAWCNRWLAAAGVTVAPQATMETANSAEQGELPADFPLFVKPRWEGTAKGILASSRVETRAELAREVVRIVTDYDQPALVEAFLPGAEYTVSLIGNDPPTILPAIQRAIEKESGIGIHAIEGVHPELAPTDPDQIPSVGEAITPGLLDADLEHRLGEMALRAFEELACRDFARVDFRLDAEGEPIFLEINPLPTFATDGTFAILAELEGCSLAEMLGRCVEAGLKRLGLVLTE